MTISGMQGDDDDDDGDDAKSDCILPTIDGIKFVNYVNEEQLDDVMRLVGQDLSEPYSIFTYRYFLHRWPQLCILAVPTDDKGDEKPNQRPIGCVVCKMDIDNGESLDDDIVNASADGFSGNSVAEVDQAHNNIHQNDIQTNGDTTSNKVYTGYIGMLAVENTHRRSGIGTALVQRAIHRMQQMGCQSIRLETEVTNKGAMTLYEDRLGFIREELLKKYYLNWGDAYRLRLWLDG